MTRQRMRRERTSSTASPTTSANGKRMAQTCNRSAVATESASPTGASRERPAAADCQQTSATADTPSSSM